MGWLFSSNWPTRKDLIDHLCEGNGVKTLKRCFKGNNMWAVQQTEAGITFAVLYLMQPSKYGWGYKDIDETMGRFGTTSRSAGSICSHRSTVSTQSRGARTCVSVPRSWHASRSEQRGDA